MEGLDIKNKLFILSITIFFLLLTSGIGSATDIIVEPGSSIQAAVNSANPYDQIIIKSGTYTENVKITKSNLTIRSESGNPDDTIIKSNRSTANVLVVNESSYVTINGVQLINSGSSYSGIYLYKCSNCVVENNKLTSNGYGIRLSGSNACTISGNTVMNNIAYGIELGNSKSNTVSGNTVSNSSRGLYLGASDYNTVTGNTVTYNNNLGFFECIECDHNTVYNNYFNNTKVTVNSENVNYYNITKTEGTNIIGGPYIGGNYWGKPDGTGFSDKAVDKDGDGISDSAYNLHDGNKDYLPLVNPLNSPAPTAPVADFSSSVTSGNVPLSVQFTDISSGTPTTWSWDFGDGNSSAEQNPVHVYSTTGSYTVSLTVSNANGINSKTSEIKVLDAVLPVADFGTNATQGSAPLAIQFTDLSQNAVSWSWDFNNDGQPDSTVQSPVYVYENPGDYTVTLTVSDANGITASKPLEIKVLDAGKVGLPVVDFETNVTSGYAPLSVLFTDHSQNANEIGWDFDDNGVPEVNSSTAVYVYTSPGTYNVNLIATNKNGTAIKTAIITVDEEGDDGGSSHSSHSGGGGGGTGGSPEPQKNVEVKELSQVFITNGKAVQFDFPKNATCVVDVGFDAIKTVGKTTTIAEQLKNKSTLVSGLPEGEVYKYFNAWVGNGGYATSENIENPVLGFKVEKTWLQNESIGKDSITLNRYEDEDKLDDKDGNWSQLSANLTGEDDKYLYFTANVPGYGSFAITGKAVQQVAEEDTQIPAEERSVGGSQPEKNETQGADSGENSSNDIMLSSMIVIVALIVIGILVKSVKK